MNTPYGIFNYELNHFCAYLAYQTNTNFSYVRQKKQITYIDNYLSHLKKEAEICFIYENEYTDKNYMDDFSTYYVNCFTFYKKTTSRIHFFKYSEKRDLKEEFKLALNSKDSIFKSKNYLGFIVIRPIPKTFLARVCLKPFHLDKNNRLKKYYLTKKYGISLFGISLQVESIAFQEQDKVLSACATTSLWSFYHAHKNLCHDMIPSSSEITKSAYPESNGYSREFPNNGLSTEMISRSLKKQNLSPEYFEFTLEKKERLQEIIYAYCSSDIPIILGVSVNDNKGVSKGLHAITALGYSLTDKVSSNLIAHGLEKIYAHDDRYGPYIRMILEKDEFKVQLDENAKTNIIDKDEVYKVDTLILGLYHKIRIPYIPIKNTCLVLSENLKDYVSHLDYVEKQVVENFCIMIDDIKWDIAIIENSNLKNELLTSNINDKENHLTNSLPKYLWNAKAIIQDIVLFQLLFDATDIEQSDVFIDYISYNHQISNDIFNILKQYAKEKSEVNINNVDRFDTKEQEDNYLNGLLNYFNKEKGYLDSLDEIFGYLKTPLLIKPEEIKDDVINDSKVFRDNFNNNSNFTLNPNLADDTQYIWVIDKDGFLCIGIEKSKNGHPTLTNGMPARIGGELKAVEREQNKYIWKINSKSGRYSSDYGKEEQNKYLENALLYKFKVIFPEEIFNI